MWWVGSRDRLRYRYAETNNSGSRKLLQGGPEFPNAMAQAVGAVDHEQVKTPGLEQATRFNYRGPFEACADRGLIADRGGGCRAFLDGHPPTA